MEGLAKMGNYSVRQLIKSQQRWNDISVQKHKHIYDVPANVKFEQGSNKSVIMFFQAMKCRHCNSFVIIPSKDSSIGVIDRPFDDLPVINLYRSHMDVGFKGAMLKNEDSDINI